MRGHLQQWHLRNVFRLRLDSEIGIFFFYFLHLKTRSNPGCSQCILWHIVHICPCELEKQLDSSVHPQNLHFPLAMTQTKRNEICRNSAFSMNNNFLIYKTIVSTAWKFSTNTNLEEYTGHTKFLRIIGGYRPTQFIKAISQ